MKTLFLLCAFGVFGHAAWVMFSDGVDTYIYNNVSGEIYVRFDRGGKNYEDIFVKMPQGVIPNNDTNNEKNVYNNDQDSRDLMQKMQEIQSDVFNKALE